MKAQLLTVEGEATFVLVFDQGEEPVEGIATFARAQQVRAGHFTGIGAFSDVVVGYYDRERRDFRRIAIREQVEVLSLVGDIALDSQQPRVHAHVVVGKADGTAHGGHLLEAHVWPTLEVVFDEDAGHAPQTVRPGNGPCAH